MDRPRTRRRGFAVGGLVFLLLVALVIALWNWDWFIPIVDTRASGALGRRVSIEHLHVRIGATTWVSADGLEIASPAGFDGKLAAIDRLTIGIKPLAFIRGRIVVPGIIVEHPRLDLLAHRDGTNNWTVTTHGSPSPSSSRPTEIGTVSIDQGAIHVDDPKVKALFDIAIQTAGKPSSGDEMQAGQAERIIADAKGTYAGQPIVGHFVGGALLSIRDKAKPYPVDLQIHNGATSVSLVGTIEQPLAFAGAKLALRFEGPDMASLLPLTGVPIPQTPPYRLTGKLDYRHDRIAFDDFAGMMGSSDLEGSITVLPAARPDVTADLRSRNVDLRDLGGFFGGAPANAPAPQAPGAAAPSHSNGDILPTKRINLPRLNAANIHLRYDGAHIEGRHIPLDNIVVGVEVVDGAITIHRLDFAIGSGNLASHGAIKPQDGDLAAQYEVNFDQVDLSRLLKATAAFHGQGVISGRATLQTTGNSIASFMGHGSGGMTLVMAGGGNVSALLSDLAGLEFGNALLSALGIPNQANVECFVADLPLQQGLITTKTLLLQTQEARTVGKGTIDLRNQTLDYAVTTRSTHFSIGSLPGPVSISGKLGAPAIRPGTEIVARAGAATALGVLLAPLAILPTVQLGVGQRQACQSAMTEIDTHPAVPIGSAAKHPHHPARSIRPRSSNGDRKAA